MKRILSLILAATLLCSTWYSIPALAEEGTLPSNLTTTGEGTAQEEPTPDSPPAEPAPEEPTPDEPTPQPEPEPTPILPSAVYLNYVSLSMTVNETKTVTAAVYPEGAVYTGSFYCDNTNVAVIDQNGILTALKKGTATVYYQTDNGISAACTVTVSNTKYDLKLSRAEIRLIYDKSIKAGSTFTLTYEAPKKEYYRVTYASKNPAIAAVDNEGKITALKKGKTEILVTADGITKKCKVTVTSNTDKRMTLNQVANRAALTKSACTRVVYGTSVQGRELEAYIIRNKNSKSRKVLFVDFACHGFEDSYARDGNVLVGIGNNLVRYYASHPSKLKNYTLVIVPCANPDGTIAGKNNKRACATAFGRCTAAHVDMNRDFGAFKGKESRALRGLMNQYRPKIYLNCHGWLDETLGTPWLTKQSARTLKLSRPRSNVYGGGYIATYVKNAYHASVCLVEYKSPKSARNSVGKTITLLNNLIKK